MAFNIDQFRSQLVRDGARPNLFEVSMPFPGIVAGGSAAQKKLTFMARTAELPGSTIGVVPMQYFGREVKLAGNRTFADWTITVINDEDFIIKNAFERWHNALNSHIGNLRNSAFTNPSSYTVDGDVNQYGKTGQVIKSYKFHGMFPADISSIGLDWGSNDTIEEFSVTFSYQYWISTGITT